MSELEVNFCPFVGDKPFEGASYARTCKVRREICSCFNYPYSVEFERCMFYVEGMEYSTHTHTPFLLKDSLTANSRPKLDFISEKTKQTIT